MLLLSKIHLLTGLALGLFLAFIIINFTAFFVVHSTSKKQTTRLGYSINLEFSDNDNSSATTVNMRQELHPGNTGDIAENVIAIKQPEKEVRVLCWIMTQGINYNKRAIPINNTWARRCTKYIFFAVYGAYNFDIPIVYLRVQEGRRYLTLKSMLAFRYIYKNYFNEADWFLKADDDTYVILENLKYFLQNKNPNEPIFFGQRFKHPWGLVRGGFSYFSGGAGYILSKEALRRFGEKGHNSSLCNQHGHTEDYDMSQCLQMLGVVLGDTSDSLGRNRFNCFSPGHHISGPLPLWYKEIESNGAKMGKQALSDYAITFHYINGNSMYGLDFLIYTVKVYNNNHTLM